MTKEQEKQIDDALTELVMRLPDLDKLPKDQEFEEPPYSLLYNGIEIDDFTYVEKEILCSIIKKRYPERIILTCQNGNIFDSDEFGITYVKYQMYVHTKELNQFVDVVYS